MQGVHLKITGPDGRSWTVPLTGAQLRLGRTADNDVVLEAGGVSSKHCVIARGPGGGFVVQDQGSTNGTWVGDQRVQGAMPIGLGTRLTVGSYFVELSNAAAAPSPAAGPPPMLGGLGGLGGGAAGVGGAMGGPPRTGPSPVVAAPIGVGARGPLLRGSEDERNARRLQDRVRRYAKEWDQAKRPSRLLLRGRNLRQALDLLELAGDADEVFGELEESFIRASAEGNERGKILRIAGIAGGSLVAIALMVFLLTREGEDEELAAKDVAGETGGEIEAADPDVEIIENKAGSGGLEIPTHERRKVKHVVVPAETLDEIAARYDVSPRMLAESNGIDETLPLEPGTELSVRTDKDPLPLPAQKITYRTDKAESWSSLAQRFDVPVTKLQAYNPKIEGKIKRGTELTIWIDPKPLERKKDIQLPSFTVRQDAISLGRPQDGQIENAIQFPKNDALYRRRNPQIMWCASTMAEELQRAVASFRYTYAFEGEIVIADMSKQRGGKFDPHQSHQSGRDVDIWLPSLKGVYQQSHMREGKERRPYPDEADWFAVYGFAKALGETGAVESVFLDKTLHDRVYNAALLMGADPDELDEMIMFHPDGTRHGGALIKHAAEHTRHVHVRFKCGPNDRCVKAWDEGPGD